MEGKIIKGIGGFYYIKICNGDIIECKARGKFRHNVMKPLVGDNVRITVENNKGVIEDIHKRTTELTRPTVSNVTLALVVFSVKNPEINFDLLYKFLVLCESKGIKSIVCLNKVDLISEKEKEEIKAQINDIGYEALFIEAKTGKGLESIKEVMGGNITVFCGPSGVGKSTLINKLSGNIHMEIGDISKKLKKGKHTTRHSELIEIQDGYIVDTPGFQTLDISHINKEELMDFFPEFENYNTMCKYTGCLHYKEPNCAVKEALKENKIKEKRYEFYIKSLEQIMKGRKYK